MNKSIQPDTSSQIADRPRYAELTPDEEQVFLQKLTELEAAFRQTGDPLSLWEALDHVERSGGNHLDLWLEAAGRADGAALADEGLFPRRHAAHDRR